MAKLLRQIEDEYRSAQLAMSGFTATAKHAHITVRMENMGAMADELTEMVGGRDQAMSLVISCMRKVEAQGHAS